MISNIIKNSAIVLFSVFLISNVISCRQKKYGSEELASLPTWVLKEEIKGSIAAVGMAPKSKGGITFQIPQAENDAIAKIGAKIKTEVNRVTKTALRESQIGGDLGAELNDVERVFTQATKNVVDTFVSGAERQNIYQSQDGTLYLQMAINKKQVQKYLEANKRIYKQKLDEVNLSNLQKEKTMKALDEAFTELDEETN